MHAHAWTDVKRVPINIKPNCLTVEYNYSHMLLCV